MGTLVGIDPATQAHDLRARGYGIVWLLPGEKNPTRKGWTLSSQEPDDYRSGNNLGLMTGRVSGDLVCVDLDAPAAIEKAAAFLPPTPMVDGRPSKQRSHLWFKVTNIPARFVSTAAGGMGGPKIIHYAGNLDILGTGAQAVCPPSRHASGEIREWDGGAIGEPAIVDCAELYAAAERLAIACGHKTKPKRLPAPSTNGAHPHNVVDRARKYLAKMPPAISGQGGHDRTFHAACVLVIDFGLSDDDALALLAEYNGRCVPPWTEKELQHKIESARQQPGERGRLRDAPYMGHGRQLEAFAACNAPALSGRPRNSPKQVVEVIREFFVQEYEPTFRRGAHIYSNKHGREIPKSEICDAPPSLLIDSLLLAEDFPRDKDGPKRGAVPSVFRNWSPLAWKDLMRSLPDEQESPEIAETAAEQFRGVVADALMTMEAFGYRHKNAEREETQRRSLVAWCNAWAVPSKKWASVRSLALWCRRDEDGQLRIALHQRLFGQIRRPAPWTHRKFSSLAELYGIGKQAIDRPGGSRAVELDPAFIADLLAGPVDGAVDGSVDGSVCTYAAENVSSTAPSTLPSTEGVKRVPEGLLKDSL